MAGLLETVPVVSFELGSRTRRDCSPTVALVEDGRDNV